MSNRARIRMRYDRRWSGWVLVLAVALGMALGAWLAVWVSGAAARASHWTDPVGEWTAPTGGVELAAAGVDVLQVLQAFTPRPAPFRLPLVAGGPGADRYPKILLVALPTFGSRQRAFLFIRPADAALCRSLHGTDLATYWGGLEPIAICAVGDPPGGETPASAVEFLLRRSS